MITVDNLYYSYDNNEKYAVKGISFDVKQGEIFGFLGPSGAGKSTTQNILTGLLKNQQGEVIVDGVNISKEDKNRFNRIGVSFEQSNLYSKLSAVDNLKYYAKLFDVDTKDPYELIKMVGLEGKEKDKVSSFSKGMKHRLTFARSLLNNPQLWFLDEPTTGLDPAIAKNIKDIIKLEKEKGVTSFLTTHNMYIAEELCDRVAFIINGEIKLIDSPKNLKLQYGEKAIEVEYLHNDKLVKELLSPKIEIEKSKLKEIIDNKEIITLHSKEATLEEIFIKVTGKELVNGQNME